MKDTVGIFFAILFCIIALVVALFGKGLKVQGFTIVCLVAFPLLVLTRDRITDLIISYKEFRVTLSKVESRLDDIARAMETLVVIQEIRTIAPDNSFTLDYDPVPKSIKIICGPFTWYARPDWGFELSGRKIAITNQDLFKSITPRLNGGFLVEYVRKVTPDDTK